MENIEIVKSITGDHYPNEFISFVLKIKRGSIEETVNVLTDDAETQEY